MMASKQLQQHAEALLNQHLAPLREYLSDPMVQEVMINSPTSIWVERAGKTERVDLQIADDVLRTAIVVLANMNDKPSTVILDSRLPGLRLAATLPPVATAGPSLCIRRHSARAFTMDDYEEQGAFATTVASSQHAGTNRPSDDEIAKGGKGLRNFLEWLARSRKNFVVTGSTSSGKTALLNAMAAFIPDDERVLTIEDTAELKIRVPNHVSFESNASYGVDIRALVRHALRYRPNRIWVGEIRGAEAYDMLDAYNTGHPGSTVTFHSDSAEMALARLENMVRMASEAANWPLEDLRRQIASTFTYVIHAANLAGHRGPAEVIEILGAENGRYQTRSLFKKTLVPFNLSTPERQS
jgi:pilus assembly protein CpaF